MRYLFLLILLGFSSTGIGETLDPGSLSQSKKIQRYYRSEFFKVSSRVQRSEPTLYRTEFTKRFPEYQNWVLKHQRFIRKNQIQLRLLLHKSGRHLRINRDVAPLYEKFYKIYRDFLDEFFLNASSHLGMITDDQYREEFRMKLITVLTELIYSTSLGIDEELPFFNSETCDYFAQPFNAVWFSTHGMSLIDQYLSLLKPTEWEAYKAESGVFLDEGQIDDDLGNLIRRLHYLEF